MWKHLGLVQTTSTPDLNSLTPEFTMIHSKWIYFQRFIYNCVNKSVSRSAFWCLPFIWYRHRAQNKCALLVSLPQTIGGQGDTKLLLPSASLWFDDFILFLFCADKGVSDGILAHGRKKWLIAKKQWKIRNTPKTLKHFFPFSEDIEGKPFKYRLCVL